MVALGMVGSGVGGEVLPGVVESTHDAGRGSSVHVTLGETLDEALVGSVRKLELVKQRFTSVYAVTVCGSTHHTSE